MFIEENYYFNQICNIFHVLIIDKSEGRIDLHALKSQTD